MQRQTLPRSLRNVSTTRFKRSISCLSLASLSFSFLTSRGSGPDVEAELGAALGSPSTSMDCFSPDKRDVNVSLAASVEDIGKRSTVVIMGGFREVRHRIDDPVQRNIPLRATPLQSCSLHCATVSGSDWQCSIAGP